MKILFAPSEGKRTGGIYPPLNSNSLIFSEFYSKRLEVLAQYEALVQKGNDAELTELFGVKDVRLFDRYKISFENAPTMKAIERYDGVAYDYLNYTTLSPMAQEYVDAHTLIFSNLFGPIRAGDGIPDYKFKQGSSLGTFAPEKFYKEHFSKALDEIIGNDEILDLRAGFYDKFYTPKNAITTLKFLKEGKVVSHWAKAYRGLVLRAVATHKIHSLEQFLALNIEGLVINEIIETKKKKEIVYAIV
ncbi:MAG: YaaA family protein [Sulfuricurvum sp.]|nr:YaaA family protein [Sulfuricurvum sp.]